LVFGWHKNPIFVPVRPAGTDVRLSGNNNK